MSILCKLGLHTARRSQGAVGYCLRPGCCDLLRSAATAHGGWVRYVERPPLGSRPERP